MITDRRCDVCGESYPKMAQIKGDSAVLYACLTIPPGPESHLALTMAKTRDWGLREVDLVEAQ